MNAEKHHLMFSTTQRPLRAGRFNTGPALTGAGRLRTVSDDVDVCNLRHVMERRVSGALGGQSGGHLGGFCFWLK